MSRHPARSEAYVFDMEEERARARRRWLIGIAAAVLAAAAFAVAGFGVLLTGLATCASDDGTPAGDSLAGRFCDSPLVVPWALLLLAGAVGAVAAGAFLALRRLRWAPLVLGAAGALAVVVVLVGAVVALPETCGDEDQAAWDAWIAAGTRGPPPVDCETY